MSGRANALISRGFSLLEREFGAVTFTIDGNPYTGLWTELGRTEVMTLNGKNVGFSVTVECRREIFTTLPKQGDLVTRTSPNQVLRIVGSVEVDETTVRFALDSRHK